jgi:lysophospholipase L1-like esterase
MSIRPHLFLLLTASFLRLSAQGFTSPHWVGTWAASPYQMDNSKGPLGQTDYTVRETVHTSLAGKGLRLVISNEMGESPLSLGPVLLSIDGTARVGTSQHQITFGGKTSILIPSGAKAFSDTLPLNLPAESNLTVSLFLPRQSLPALTTHGFADQPNFMAPGDQTEASNLSQPTEFDSWVFLSAVEVQATARGAAIVTLGDSITDGAFSTRGANRRWPDDLARRLQADPRTAHLSVLNEGIGGNRLLHTGNGPSALERFDRDVLSQASVKHLILLEGINDIGVSTGPATPHDTVTPDELIWALAQLIERAHSQGLSFYYTEAGEAERQAVNRWIRSNKLADGVIDFDKAVLDPADPQRLRPAFDSDHIHPNDAGHQAMADSIDLSLFAR